MSVDFEQERQIDDLIDSTIVKKTNDIQYIPEHLNEESSTCDLLKMVLGEIDMVSKYTNAERKYRKYPMEKLYLEPYETLKAKLEVQLTSAKLNFKSKLKEILMPRTQCSLL